MSNAKKPATLTVKPHKIGGFGITDGRKWFAYTYKLRTDAEKIADKMRGDERCIAVNISRDEPLKVIESIA